jgi:hypothetical protein
MWRWGLTENYSVSQIALMESWPKKIFCIWRSRIKHAPCWGISKDFAKDHTVRV